MLQQPRLPCPEFTITVELPADSTATIELAELPAKSGVLAIEDASGHTVALSATANLRRTALTKLQPPAADSKPTRQIDYRAIARRLRGLRVGSAFEADWAWLQHARLRMPQTYRAALDRWQAWFVQCNPDTEFPQFIKTAHASVELPATTVHVGPFPEKHAAGRYIEMLEDAFDLCRYHHILIQAPRGSPCAYKEMGRCPAPCDGTVPLDQYREQVHAAIEFASSPVERWRADEESSMQQASQSLNFEKAQRHRQRLERTSISLRPEFAYVNRLERFAFIAVMPGPTKKLARVFLIRGGWIDCMGDVAGEAGDEDFSRLCDEIYSRLQPQAVDYCGAAIENIGLTCWHLFRQRGSKHAGVFLRLNDEFSVDHMRNAVRSLKSTPPAEAEADAAIVEHDVELSERN